MSDEYDNRVIVESAYEALAQGNDDAFIHST